jgi:N-acetylneuraminic acid mutarotase
MAGQTLGAGVTPRKRVLFGLLDADGWSWATLKALFWFIAIIFLLGYIPDRAYYFTVFSTIDLGINAVSPVNLCPPENKTLPCPAPVGAVVPWEPAPVELNLPAPRVDGEAVQVGSKFLYVGGSDGQTAQSTVYVTDAFAAGTYAPWKDGPALPAPRSKSAVVFLGGSVYSFGGYDASGTATKDAYILTPDATTGALSAWKTATDAKLPIDLPEARAGAAIVAVSDGLIIVGGAGPDGKPTNTVWKATTDTSGKLGAWQPNPGMTLGSGTPEPRVDATAALNGSSLYVYGGSNENGPTTTVLRADTGIAALANGSASPSPSASAPTGPIVVLDWAEGVGASNLPVPRTEQAGYVANGGLYIVGGTDGQTPKGELYWAIPDSNGNIAQWMHLAASDLPAQGLVGSSAVVNGANVFLIGGRTANGVTAGAARANLAPQPPFFQLGLIGATVPALKIDGEVGQQLGYLAAAGAGTVNFILLLLIGWAYAHPARTKELWHKVVHRGRKSS